MCAHTGFICPAPESPVHPGLSQVGLLYDSDALSQASALIADWTTEERAYLRATVPKMGLDTPFRGKPLRDVAAQAVAISKVRVLGRCVSRTRTTTFKQTGDVPRCGRQCIDPMRVSSLCRAEGSPKADVQGGGLHFFPRGTRQFTLHSHICTLSPRCFSSSYAFLMADRSSAQAIVKDGMSVADRRLKEYATTWGNSVDPIFLKHAL